MSLEPISENIVIVGGGYAGVEVYLELIKKALKSPAQE